MAIAGTKFWNRAALGPGEESPLPAGAVLRRFRSALPASVLLAKNRPAHLRSAKVQGAVRAEKGPYMASGNWWDENAWGRAEWDVELENERDLPLSFERKPMGARWDL